MHVPYLEGERTPNLPHATGELHGMTLGNLTPENLARAAVEGLLGLLGQAIDGMRAHGVAVETVTLLGGGARSEAVRRLAPAVWGLPSTYPPPVARRRRRRPSGRLGARGRRRAAGLGGSPLRGLTAEPTPEVMERYAAAARSVADRA